MGLRVWSGGEIFSKKIKNTLGGHITKVKKTRRCDPSTAPVQKLNCIIFARNFEFRTVFLHISFVLDVVDALSRSC